MFSEWDRSRYLSAVEAMAAVGLNYLSRGSLMN